MKVHQETLFKSVAKFARNTSADMVGDKRDSREMRRASVAEFKFEFGTATVGRAVVCFQVIRARGEASRIVVDRGSANNTHCRQPVSMHNSNSRTAVRGTAEPSEFSLPFLPPLLVNT